jgi:hypothetical protein
MLEKRQNKVLRKRTTSLHSPKHLKTRFYLAKALAKYID